jgi:regulator of sirC expression with transglutaminase-like and TPR domain
MMSVVRSISSKCLHFMPTLQQFEKDEQFMRLVRREGDIDLVTAALEIARDGQPDLEFEPTLTKIRKAVSELTRPIAMADDEVSELNLLVEYLTEELNLHGHNDSFDSAECSYLNCVMESGRGIPISLSVIYMAVANELGIPLIGVAAPSHFLTQLQTDREVLYVDAFRRGHIMNERECVQWLHELTELPMAEIWPTLKPTNERRIMVRMLNNLKAVFGNNDEWASAWRVQQRLALLSPGSYREKRDLAILSLRAGRGGEAVTQLESCIAVCSPEERPQLQQYLREAVKEAPRYN